MAGFLRSEPVTRVRNSLPLLGLTLVYLEGSVTEWQLFGIDERWLSRLFMLEFFAIHSFPFMMFLLIWSPRRDKMKGLRMLLVLLLAFLYLLGAHAMAGWPGLFALVPLVVGTYFGFMVKGIHRSLIPELSIRGGLYFVAFIASALIFDLPQHVDEWDGMSEAVWAGLFYFVLLTLLEATAWPEKWGSGIARTMFGGNNIQPTDEPLAVPTTWGGTKAATVPLLLSVGLALLPYVVLPFVAGFVGRIIDEAVSWPHNIDVNRFWYFLVYVSVFASVRGWQLGKVFRTKDPGRWKYMLAAMWIVFGLTGYLSFFTGDSMSIHYVWTLEDLGWIVGVDVPLLFVLVPMVWVSVNPDEEAGR